MSFITVSAERVILSGVDQRQRLRAELHDEENNLSGDLISWRSSAPDVVQVSQDGELKAMTDVGYAVVTASYGDAIREIPVMVAKLASGSRILERDRVRSASKSADVATLVLDDDTATLRVGDIVINDAVFGRITHLERRGREIFINTEMVPLPEAFTDLRIDVVAGVEVEVTASPEGVTVSAPRRAGGRDTFPGGGLNPLFMSMLDLPVLPSAWMCEAGAAGQVKDVEIESGTITWTCTFDYAFSYALSLFAPPSMSIDVSHFASMSRTSDTFKLKPGIQYYGSCYLKVGPIFSPPITIPGTPILITFYATPKAGFEVSVTPSWPLELRGPSISGHAIAYRAGLTYSGESWDGYAAVDNFTLGSIVPGELVSIEEEVETHVGPFAAVSFAMGIGIPGADVKVEFLKPKAHVTWKHKIGTPLNRFHLAYAGPQWKIVSGAKTWLGLKLHSKELKRAFGYLGVSVGFNAHEFVHLEDEWVRSPRPSVTRQPSALPYSTVLVASIVQANNPYVLTELYQGWTVDFVATRLGDTIGVTVGSATLNAAGVASFFWDMLTHPPGDYSVRAQIRNPSWLITQIFPYTSNSAVDVTVVDPRATVRITSPFADTVTAGNLLVKADYHYPFDTPHAGQIQWLVNGAVFDTQAIQGVDGETEAIVCLLPPEATIEARIVDTNANGTVLTSSVKSLTVFASAELPEGATTCGDVDGTEVRIFDSAVAGLREVRELLRQFGGRHQHVNELRGSPHRRALSMFRADVTAPLRRSIDLLQMKSSRIAASQTVDELLARTLELHRLSGRALREPRTQVVEQLSARYSGDFLEFVDDLFRVVDERSLASGVASFRDLSADVLSRSEWTDEEGEQILQLLLLVAIAIDHLVPATSEYGTMVRLRFDRAADRPNERADNLAPARAAVSAQLSMLAADSHANVGAALEVSLLAALATAVRMAHP